MKSGNFQKYGEDWESRGVKLRDLNIIVAPELFVAHRISYLPSGAVVFRGTEYFTWNMARELVSHRRVPSGWRLPTAEEASVMCRFHDDELAFWLNGFVCADKMGLYCRNPESGKTLVTSKDSVGYYWTNDFKNLSYPYAILLSGVSTGGCVSICPNFGLSMLLVKDV